MSLETTSEDRAPRERELEKVGAGKVGIPVDAICTGCKTVRVKRAPESDREDRRAEVSFRHVCHSCKTATYWNTIKVLDGLLPEGDDVDELEDDQEDEGGRSE